MRSRAEFKAELGLGCSLRGAGLVGVTRFAVLPVSSVPSQALRGAQEDVTAAAKMRVTENTCSHLSLHPCSPGEVSCCFLCCSISGHPPALWLSARCRGLSPVGPWDCPAQWQESRTPGAAVSALMKTEGSRLGGGCGWRSPGAWVRG